MARHRSMPGFFVLAARLLGRHQPTKAFPEIILKLY